MFLINKYLNFFINILIFLLFFYQYIDICTRSVNHKLYLLWFDTYSLYCLRLFIALVSGEYFAAALTFFRLKQQIKILLLGVFAQNDAPIRSILGANIPVSSILGVNIPFSSILSLWKGYFIPSKGYILKYNYICIFIIWLQIYLYF